MTETDDSVPIADNSDGVLNALSDIETGLIIVH